jgi:hypothetical protein
MGSRSSIKPPAALYFSYAISLRTPAQYPPTPHSHSHSHSHSIISETKKALIHQQFFVTQYIYIVINTVRRFRC